MTSPIAGELGNAVAAVILPHRLRMRCWGRVNQIANGCYLPIVGRLSAGSASTESAASRAPRARLAPVDHAADDPPMSAARAPESDEAALLRCIALGDQAAMAEFYQLHCHAVLTHVSLIVGERALA